MSDLTREQVGSWKALPPSSWKAAITKDKFQLLCDMALRALDWQGVEVAMVQANDLVTINEAGYATVLAIGNVPEVCLPSYIPLYTHPKADPTLAERLLKHAKRLDEHLEGENEDENGSTFVMREAAAALGGGK